MSYDCSQCSEAIRMAEERLKAAKELKNEVEKRLHAIQDSLAELKEISKFMTYHVPQSSNHP